MGTMALKVLNIEHRTQNFNQKSQLFIQNHCLSIVLPSFQGRQTCADKRVRYLPRKKTISWLLEFQLAPQVVLYSRVQPRDRSCIDAVQALLYRILLPHRILARSNSTKFIGTGSHTVPFHECNLYRHVVIFTYQNPQISFRLFMIPRWLVVFHQDTFYTVLRVCIFVFVDPRYTNITALS